MHFLSLLFLIPLTVITATYKPVDTLGQSPKLHATIHSIDDHSAHISFFSPILPPQSYAFEVRTSGPPNSGENGLVFSGHSLQNEVSISDLLPGMMYTVYVKYEYDDLEMQWIYGTAFNTSVCSMESKIDLQFQLIDAKGDGWNGTILGIKQAGIDIGELYLNDGSKNTGTISICSEEITEIYVKHLGENSEDISLIVNQKENNFSTTLHQTSALSTNQVILSKVFSTLHTQR